MEERHYDLPSDWTILAQVDGIIRNDTKIFYKNLF